MSAPLPSTTSTGPPSTAEAADGATEGRVSRPTMGAALGFGELSCLYYKMRFRSTLGLIKFLGPRFKAFLVLIIIYILLFGWIIYPDSTNNDDSKPIDNTTKDEFKLSEKYILIIMLLLIVQVIVQFPLLNIENLTHSASQHLLAMPLKSTTLPRVRIAVSLILWPLTSAITFIIFLINAIIQNDFSQIILGIEASILCLTFLASGGAVFLGGQWLWFMEREKISNRFGAILAGSILWISLTVVLIFFNGLALAFFIEYLIIIKALIVLLFIVISWVLWPYLWRRSWHLYENVSLFFPQTPHHGSHLEINIHNRKPWDRLVASWHHHWNLGDGEGIEAYRALEILLSRRIPFMPGIIILFAIVFSPVFLINISAIVTVIYLNIIITLFLMTNKSHYYDQASRAHILVSLPFTANELVINSVWRPLKTTIVYWYFSMIIVGLIWMQEIIIEPSIATFLWLFFPFLLTVIMVSFSYFSHTPDKFFNNVFLVLFYGSNLILFIIGLTIASSNMVGAYEPLCLNWYRFEHLFITIVFYNLPFLAVMALKLEKTYRNWEP